MTEDRCQICGDDMGTRLQEHHIVPKRHGGTDSDENLVTLCAGCHQAVERIYDERFFSIAAANLDVETTGSVKAHLEAAASILAENKLRQLTRYREQFSEFDPTSVPATEIPSDENMSWEDFGIGEKRGYFIGYVEGINRGLEAVDNTHEALFDNEVELEIEKDDGIDPEIKRAHE